MSTRSVVTEFLEACFHSILFCRGVYPRRIFEKRSIFGTWTPQSTHSGVNNYIHDTCQAIRHLLANEDIRRVIFVIMSEQTGETLESYSIQLTMIKDTINDPEGVRARFHEVIKKLNSLNALITKELETPSFRIFIETKGGLVPHAMLDDKWSPVEEVERPLIDNPAIIPLKSIRTGEFCLNIHVEVPFTPYAGIKEEQEDSTWGKESK